MKHSFQLAMRHIRDLHATDPRLVWRFVLTSLGKSIAGLATILLTRDFLAGILGGQTLPGAAGTIVSDVDALTGLWFAAGALFASIVATSLFSFDNRISQQRMVQKLELSIMDRLVRHLLTLSVSFFDAQSPGDLLQAVRQDVVALRSLVFAVAGIVLEALTALGLFVAALWISPKLTLWSLIVLPLAAIPVLMAARRATARSRAIRSTGYVLFDALLEMLRGIRVVKVYRGDDRIANATMDKSRRYFDETIEMVRVQSVAQVLLEMIAGLGIVIVVVVGGLDVMKGTLQWPSLLAFVLAVRALYGPVNNLNTSLIGLGSLRASTDRIADLLATRPQVPERDDAKPLSADPTHIHFASVGFSYQDRRVLHDVSLTVRAGETIGIAGPSGAGKTTFLNLIARFYDPTTGHVAFDDTDLRDLRLDTVYDRIGIVTQVPFLFAASVRENIRCGRPSATDREVEEAAAAAGIHDEILRFTNGYDTPLGIGGTGVSGGQAQRINIARALIKNPPILLLDEATASLDSLSEMVVQDALERLMTGRTTFVVAHRLSTLRSADRILVLDGGSVAGVGTHEALLVSCAVYREMWSAQSLDATPVTAAVDG